MADRKLIKDGIVLTLDREVGDFDRADVLVEDGVIVAVGPDLEAPEGAEVIDAAAGSSCPASSTPTATPGRRSCGRSPATGPSAST
jgi:cytosine/adenosine deaminase-related metal-dependent hydrolase